jgi:undecaprenyl diphosphate synthase
VRRILARVERLTRKNHGMTVLLALSYSGRDDIVSMVRWIAREVKGGKYSVADIDERLIARRVATGAMPDPDLLIRTSGEMRVSNFFLWQIAYTELYVTPTLWPDFREPQYLQALLDFQRRQRRFGRTDEQIGNGNGSDDGLEADAG